MKYSELIRLLTKSGCRFISNGGRHDLWENKDGMPFFIPRHQSAEVPKGMERKILKWAGIK